MWIKFRKPAPGYAYSEGNTADLLPEEEAVRLVEEEYAIPFAGAEPVSDLPDDFPARALLVAEGMCTLEQVKRSLPSLSDVKGIGESTLEKIVERLKEMESEQA